MSIARDDLLDVWLGESPAVERVRVCRVRLADAEPASFLATYLLGPGEPALIEMLDD